MNEFPVPTGFWDLPSCPQVIQQILQLAPLGEKTMPELLDIVRWDPALTVRILAAANATKFGQVWPVIALDRARLLLEDFPFRMLSLQFSLDSLLADNEPYQPFYESYWRQSHIQAVTVQILSRQHWGQSEIQPFLAGLLCNLDRLGLLKSQPETYREIFENVFQTAQTWDASQQSIVGDKQILAHKQLLRQGTFPDVYLAAIPSQSQGEDQTAPPLQQVLSVAQALGDYLVFGDQQETANPTLSQPWFERLQHVYESYSQSHAASELSLEQLMLLVRQSLLKESSKYLGNFSALEMLGQAGRELGRLGWEACVAFGRTQTRAKQAEHSLLQYQRKIASLEHQALRDPLTGVYNRRFLLEALQKEVARCCRYGAPIGLLFVDVDNFKPLNDTWGHIVGDVVLRRVADTLTDVLRDSDILARYGGEEFVILPNNPNEKGIGQLAERIRQAIEELSTQVEGGQLQVTVSVGCTLTVPTRSDLALGPQLLASADAAMYDAKQRGKNRVVFHSLLEESERVLMQRTLDCSFSRWLVQQNLLNEQVVETLLLDFSSERLPLGELAIETGLLTRQEVALILDSQVNNDDRFGALALQENLLTPNQLAMLLARQRENPIQFARLLIGKSLLQESEALELVGRYLSAAQMSADRTLDGSDSGSINS